MKPRTWAVPPVRNASASSMQSPPASAEATSVIILSPGLARPGASPRSRRCWTSSGRPRCRAKVAGRSRPALEGAGQAVVVEGDLDAVGVVAWQHLLGAPSLGSVLCFENHYPRSTGAPSCRFASLTRRPPSVDSGLGKCARTGTGNPAFARLVTENSQASAVDTVIRTGCAPRVSGPLRAAPP